MTSFCLFRSEMTACTYCGEMVGSDAKITIEHLNISCHPSCFKVRNNICTMCRVFFFFNLMIYYPSVLSYMTTCFHEICIEFLFFFFILHPSVLFAVNQWETCSTICFSIVGQSIVRAAIPTCYNETLWKNSHQSGLPFWMELNFILTDHTFSFIFSPYWYKIF